MIWLLWAVLAWTAAAVLAGLVIGAFIRVGKGPHSGR